MIDENLNLHWTIFIDNVGSLVGDKIVERKTQCSDCKQSIFFEVVAFTPSLYFPLHFDTFDSETY